MAEQPRLSVIVPTLNEAATIELVLRPLQRWRKQGVELILVDGGSEDRTRALAEPLVDLLLDCPPGRARQMNAGAARARAPWLWFLHADSSPQDVHLRSLMVDQRRAWGRFDVRLSGRRWLFRVIETLINLRSRLTGIATGDQGIFLRRKLFERLGGFPDQPLMEDVALSRHLLQITGRPACLRPPLTTNSRRWEQHGAWRTIWLMWRLRWRYWRGEDPARLHALYYRGRRHG